FSIFFLLPVIMVTWQTGRRAGLVTCLLAAGAWLIAEEVGGREYSSELFPIWNALVRLGFFMIVSLLIARTKEVAHLANNLARTDPLTGLANSRHFYEVCGLEIEKARRNLRPLTVAYLDIDNFKRINDSMGHSSGDELLRFVAGEMTRMLRSTDTIARLGGDEFVLLLAETNQQEADHIVARLHDVLTHGVRQHGWPAGFSIGVASYEAMPDSVDDLLHQADMLMYQAKKLDQESICFRVFS
ncbi:MAG: GGDEF domain-containing protein, partial [Thermoleophilia bacterium]